MLHGIKQAKKQSLQNAAQCQPSKTAKSANCDQAGIEHKARNAGREAVRHGAGAAEAGHLQCAWCRPVLPGCRQSLCCHSCRCAVLALQSSKGPEQRFAHAFTCLLSLLHPSLQHFIIHPFTRALKPFSAIHSHAAMVLENQLGCKTCPCQQQLPKKLKGFRLAHIWGFHLIPCVYMIVCCIKRMLHGWQCAHIHLLCQCMLRGCGSNVVGLLACHADVSLMPCHCCYSEGRNPFSRGAYCLGKIVWGKGWEELIALLSQHTEARSQVLLEPLDIYGTGEAASEVWSSTGLFLSCRIIEVGCGGL